MTTGALAPGGTSSSSTSSFSQSRPACRGAPPPKAITAERRVW